LIKLSLPSSASNRFGILEGLLIGPFSSVGAAVSEEVSYRYGADYLTQHKGTFHENFVDNLQVEANIGFLPQYADIVPSPTTNYPDRIIMHTKTGSTLKDLDCQWGVANSGSVTRYITSGTCMYKAVEISSSGKLIIYWIQTSSPTATVFLTCTKTEYTFTGLSSNLALFNRETWGLSASSTPLTRTGNYANCPTFEAVKNGVIANIASGSSLYSANAILYNAKTPYASDMLGFQATADVLIKSICWARSFPIAGTDYGNLAMDATSKLNFTNVNVLELVHDLRHPLDMIPKLKNLSNLGLISKLRKAKRAAGTYLTIHYGLLPNISDLSRIWDSFCKKIPLLDRNGFHTCNAGYAETLTMGNITYRTEQHIKIAVADVDSQLIELINKAESIGILPTFSNVWDLIPFSFVLDWFINIGDFLERFDAGQRIQRLNIQYVTTSRKDIVSGNLIPSASSPYVGTVEMAHYTRWVSDQCPVPPLSPSDNLTVSNHWLEAGALLIQRAH
jgi:hypothetical protein